MHRIGEDVEFEQGWDTPTLREVWRTAPYLFDGRAATMKEVFEVYKHGIDKKISSKEADELAEYVLSLIHIYRCFLSCSVMGWMLSSVFM